MVERLMYTYEYWGIFDYYLRLQVFPHNLRLDRRIAQEIIEVVAVYEYTFCREMSGFDCPAIHRPLDNVVIHSEACRHLVDGTPFLIYFLFNNYLSFLRIIQNILTDCSIFCSITSRISSSRSNTRQQSCQTISLSQSARTFG